MARHHSKKKKQKGYKYNAKDKITKMEEEEDLDRFAGSSEEEEEDDRVANEAEEDNEADDDGIHQQVMKKNAPREDDSDKEVEDEDDDNEEEEEDKESIASEGDEEQPFKDEGMANAMSKILHTTTKKHSSIPILSKTTTPLQRELQKQRQKSREEKEKRKKRREDNLIAMHNPIRRSDCGATLSAEFELERTLKRVATRGVVALFNTVSKHQSKTTRDNAQNASSSTNEPSEKMTKRKFLDMIKQTANQTEQEEEKDTLEKKQKHQRKNIPPNKQREQTNVVEDDNVLGWKALSDDFMIGSKLKDWDKELSDDGSDSDEDGTGVVELGDGNLSDED